MHFESIVKDIQSLKIQGAENIAKASVKAILIVAEKLKNSRKTDMLHYLNHAKQILFKTRITEPCMRNTLNYLLKNIEFSDNIYSHLHARLEAVKKHFEESNKKIAMFGAKKISSRMIVFTHCHSSAVINILKKAKQEGKRFAVHNTETRPLFQGRITASELAREGIPVVHYIDSAARIALKKADIMLIGADAINSEGFVFNKIGSEMFAEIAAKYDIPVYVCSDSWKFDAQTLWGFEERIEKRHEKEVWPGAPKGVRINNYAFEKINPSLITGIISELGIYRPEVFAEEVISAYPWIK